MEIEHLLKLESLKIVYHSTKEYIRKRMITIGNIALIDSWLLKLVKTEITNFSNTFFNEQDKFEGKKQKNVLLQSKEEFSENSV